MLALVAASVRAEEPAAAPAQPFQPGEISIGEPIALPFGSRVTPPAGAPVAQPGDDPRSTAPQAAVDADTVPGSGWLGLAVAESSVPGRWRVEDVTAGGPAARAGIAVGDELRAVNGSTLSSAEAASQALTAIAAGQDVRVAVARGDQVADVVLRAETRPTVRPAGPSAAIPTQLPSAVAAAPAAAAPTPAVQPAAPPQVAGAGWQSAEPRAPAEAASRFAAATPPPAASVMAPAAPPAAFVPPTPTLPARPADRGPPGRTALGVRTLPIDPATQARFQLREPAGAYVIGVVDGLPAGKAGVPPGSVIVAVGDQPVRSPVELTRLVTNGPLDKPVTVEFVLPGGEAKRANVVLQSLDAPLERVLAGDSGTVAPAPRPRRAERPVGGESRLQPDIRGEIRAEIRGLRGRLERLERLLESTVRPGR